MAIYKPGHAYGSISGSAGGLIWTRRDRFGHVYQPRPGVRRRSAASAAASAARAAVVQSWQSLTDAQRAGWNEHANTIVTLAGDPGDRRLSGQARYVAANTRRAAAGQPPLTDAPPAFTPEESFQGLDVTADLTSQELVIRTLEGFFFVTLQPLTLGVILHEPRPGKFGHFRANGRLAGHVEDVVTEFPFTPAPLRLPAPWPLNPGSHAWLTSHVTAANGLLGPRREQFVWLPSPGHSFAARVRPRFASLTRWSLTINANQVQVSFLDGQGDRITATETLGPGGLPTVGDLVSWIVANGEAESRDVDSSLQSHDARDVQGFARRGGSRFWNLIPLEIPT